MDLFNIEQSPFLDVAAPKISIGRESVIPEDYHDMGGFDTFDNALDVESQRVSQVTTVSSSATIEEVLSTKKSKPTATSEEELKEQKDRERASFRLSLLRGDEDEEPVAGQFYHIFNILIIINFENLYF